MTNAELYKQCLIDQLNIAIEEYLITKTLTLENRITELEKRLKLHINLII